MAHRNHTLADVCYIVDPMHQLFTALRTCGQRRAPSVGVLLVWCRVYGAEGCVHFTEQWRVLPFARLWSIDCLLAAGLATLCGCTASHSARQSHYPNVIPFVWVMFQQILPLWFVRSFVDRLVVVFGFLFCYLLPVGYGRQPPIFCPL